MSKKDIKESLNDIRDIRNLMQDSTRFLNLSGVSAILVGVYACIGAYMAYIILGSNSINHFSDAPILHVNTPYRLKIMVLLAFIILAACLVSVFGMSYRKARRSGKTLSLTRPMKNLLWNFFLPLLTGGVLCFSAIYQGHYGLTSSIMLIFYGLALINGSKYTYSHTRYLGYAEILLGLLDSFVQGYALIFWVIGFGLFHMVYGLLFYLQIERKQNQREHELS